MKQKKKNNLFGKVRSLLFFDLFIFVIFALVAVFFLYFFLRKSEYVTLTLRVSSSDSLADHWYDRPAQWYLSVLQPGLESVDLLGRPIVSVTDTYYYPTYSNLETVFVNLNVRAVYNKNTNEYSYNGIPLLVGKLVDFNVGGVYVQGIIHSIEGDDTDSKLKYRVSGELEYIQNGRAQEEQAELEGVRTFLSESIFEGKVYEDSKGEAYAVLTDVEKENAYKKFIYNNSVVTMLDEEREKVFVTADILVENINGVPHYQGQTIIKKGAVIPFHSEEASIYLTIYDMELLAED